MKRYIVPVLIALLLAAAVVYSNQPKPKPVTQIAPTPATLEHKGKLPEWVTLEYRRKTNGQEDNKTKN